MTFLIMPDCPYCGRNVSPNAASCPKCGEPSPGEYRVKISSSKEKMRIGEMAGWSLFGGVALALAITVYIALSVEKATGRRLGEDRTIELIGLTSTCVGSIFVVLCLWKLADYLDSLSK